MDIGSLTGTIALEDQFSSVLSSIGSQIESFATGTLGMIATGATVAVAALAGVTGAIISLGNQGSDVNDAAASLDLFAGSAANADAILQKMREGTLGTITDFALMKDAAKLLAGNVKLTADDFGTLTQASFVLQNQGFGPTGQVLDNLTASLLRGNDRLAKAYGLTIDVARAEGVYRESIGAVSRTLTPLENQEVKRLALMDALRSKVAEAGAQQRDFGEQMEFAATTVKNFTNDLASQVAASPAVMDAVSGIGEALLDAFGGTREAAIQRIVGWIETFANGISAALPYLVSFAQSLGDAHAWVTQFTTSLVLPTSFQTGLDAYNSVLQSVNETLNDVYESIRPVLTTLGSPIWAAAAAVGMLISDAFGFIGTALEFVWKVIKPVVDIMAEPIWSAAVAVFNLLAAAVGVVADALGLVFRAGSAVLRWVIESDIVWKAWSFTVSAVTGILRGVLNVVEAAADGFTWLFNKVRDLLGLFKDTEGGASEAQASLEGFSTAGVAGLNQLGGKITITEAALNDLGETSATVANEQDAQAQRMLANRAAAQKAAAAAAEELRARTEGTKAAIAAEDKMREAFKATQQTMREMVMWGSSVTKALDDLRTVGVHAAGMIADSWDMAKQKMDGFLAAAAKPVKFDLESFFEMGAVKGPDFSDMGGGIDWGVITASAKSSLREQADITRRTYKYMLDHSDLFTENAIRNYKRLSEESEAAAEGTQTTWQRAYDALGDVATILDNIPGKFAEITSVVARTGQAIMKNLTEGDVWGAVIAGVTGAIQVIKNLFGGISEEVKKARTDLEKFNDGLVETMTASQRAEAAGRSWAETVIVVRDAYLATGRSAEEALAATEAMWDTDNPARSAAAIAKVTEVMEEYEAQAEGASKALGALNANVKNGIHDQGTYNQTVTASVLLFDDMYRKTGDLFGALQQLDPALDAIVVAQNELGYAGNAAIEQLLRMRDATIEHEAFMTSLQTSTALLQGLGQAGMLTAENIVDFGQSAVNEMAVLESITGSTTEAFVFMRPKLQALWEQQQKLGSFADEATEALVNQAREAGIVGPEMEDMNKQLLNVMKDIRDMIGEVIGKTNDFGSAISRLPREHRTRFVREYVDEGSAAEGYAGGGTIYAAGGASVTPFVPRGSDVRPAMVTPGERILSTAQNMVYEKGMNRTVTVPVYLDGREIARGTVPYIPDELERQLGRVS